MTVYVDALMTELAAAMPHLPAARCAGRHELFDLTAERSQTGPAGAAEVCTQASHRQRSRISAGQGGVGVKMPLSSTNGDCRGRGFFGGEERSTTK